MQRPRGTTPNTNSNSPRKNSQPKHVISTKDSLKGANSVSMLVLAKLDNSLIQQSQSMTKTGGFVGKKKTGAKVLNQFLAEKQIDDLDRRQILIKQALDNNTKVKQDRRKSANATQRKDLADI